jgi:hypothetical protein
MVIFAIRVTSRFSTRMRSMTSGSFLSSYFPIHGKGKFTKDMKKEGNTTCRQTGYQQDLPDGSQISIPRQCLLAYRRK